MICDLCFVICDVYIGKDLIDDGVVKKALLCLTRPVKQQPVILQIQLYILNLLRNLLSKINLRSSQTTQTGPIQSNEGSENKSEGSEAKVNNALELARSIGMLYLIYNLLKPS